jgi:hypothetical protein
MRENIRVAEGGVVYYLKKLGGREIYTGFWWEHLKERYLVGHLGIYGMIFFCILINMMGCRELHFFWLVIGQVAVCGDGGNKTSNFI